MEVGAMRRPMPECEPPTAHIIIPSLSIALEFCLLVARMMSPSIQLLANVGVLNPFKLTSGTKASSPLA